MLCNFLQFYSALCPEVTLRGNFSRYSYLNVSIMNYILKGKSKKTWHKRYKKIKINRQKPRTVINSDIIYSLLEAADANAYCADLSCIVGVKSGL